jgi:hypothetical protein
MQKKSMSEKFGFSFRTAILVALLLQNSGYTLLRKYSTMTEDVSSKEILLVGELIKLVFSTYVVLFGNEQSDAQGFGLEKLIWLIRRSFKMFALAAIYLTMNVLSFVALQYIGAGEFTVRMNFNMSSFSFDLLNLSGLCAIENSYHCWFFRSHSWYLPVGGKVESTCPACPELYSGRQP